MKDGGCGFSLFCAYTLSSPFSRLAFLPSRLRNFFSFSCLNMYFLPEFVVTTPSSPGLCMSNPQHRRHRFFCRKSSKSISFLLQVARPRTSLLAEAAPVTCSVFGWMIRFPFAAIPSLKEDKRRFPPGHSPLSPAIPRWSLSSIPF